MKKKTKILLPLVTLSITTFGLLGYFMLIKAQHKDSTPSSNNQPIEIKPAKEIFSMHANTASTATPELNIAEIERWKIKRGTDLSHDPEYESYDVKTLVELGKNGDIRALGVLANTYTAIPTPEAQKYARKVRWRLAMHGSSYATKMEAISLLQQRSYVKTEKEKHKLLLEGLAWFKLGSLFGDPTYYYQEVNSPTYETEGLTLSDNDRKSINYISQKLFERLNELRKNNGLSEYDTSMPQSVKQYFESIDPRNMKKNGF